MRRPFIPFTTLEVTIRELLVVLVFASPYS